ncbi:MAG: hypothetical protein J2P37_07795, partial [Ktedonobacteraceae bacterium]|nr:hypothetical protein [Ktedonobacteraceae bacterium]
LETGAKILHSRFRGGLRRGDANKCQVEKSCAKMRHNPAQPLQRPMQSVTKATQMRHNPAQPLRGLMQRDFN